MSIELLDSKDKQELQEQNENKIDKSGITLGVHTDGLTYVFVDGVPIGNGVISPSIEAPQIVSSIEEMTDTTKHYVFNGYIYSCREETQGGDVTYPNVFIPSAAQLNTRLSGSTGNTSARDGYFITNFIAVPNYADLTPYNIRINWKLPLGSSSYDSKAVFYDSNKNHLGYTMLNAVEDAAETNGGMVLDLKLQPMDATPDENKVAYVRLEFCINTSLASLTSADIENLSITFDAVFETTEGSKTYEWVNSGISYLPNIKTDLIGVLTEDNVIYLSDNLPSGTYTLKYGDETYDTVGTITVD